MTDTLVTPADDAPAFTSKVDAVRDGAMASITGYADGSLVGYTVTIAKPRSDLYAFWRDFTNLPQFMDNVDTITRIDDTRSHWVVKAPRDETVEWDAIVTEDRADTVIAWRSDPDGDITNSGRVTFTDAQGDRGTVVQAIIAYDPPGGTIGKLVAKLFQREPSIQVRRDLRRFKQLMETGEVSTNVRNPAQLREEGK